MFYDCRFQITHSDLSCSSSIGLGDAFPEASDAVGAATVREFLLLLLLWSTLAYLGSSSPPPTPSPLMTLTWSQWCFPPSPSPLGFGSV